MKTGNRQAPSLRLSPSVARASGERGKHFLLHIGELHGPEFTGGTRWLAGSILVGARHYCQQLNYGQVANALIYTYSQYCRLAVCLPLALTFCGSVMFVPFTDCNNSKEFQLVPSAAFARGKILQVLLL